MKPPVFRYSRARSLEEALGLLAAEGGDAKALAGGQSLMPLLNLRLAGPAHLVDINPLTELSYIERTNGSLRIGAVTRQREILVNPLVRQHCPLLAAATKFIGHPAIRNRGTVGGSIAQADPAAELPVVFMALDARFALVRTGARRLIDATRFFTGSLMTVMEPEELLVEISVGISAESSGWGFHEVARRHGDFALAAAAAVLSVADGRISRVALALGGVSDRPIRSARAEGILLGKSPTSDLVDEAVGSIVEEINPDSDVHASAEYRKHLAQVLARRALRDAIRRVAPVPGREARSAGRDLDYG